MGRVRPRAAARAHAGFGASGPPAWWGTPHGLGRSTLAPRVERRRRSAAGRRVLADGHRLQESCDRGGAFSEGTVSTDAESGLERTPGLGTADAEARGSASRRGPDASRDAGSRRSADMVTGWPERYFTIGPGAKMTFRDLAAGALLWAIQELQTVTKDAARDYTDMPAPEYDHPWPASSTACSNPGRRCVPCVDGRRGRSAGVFSACAR